MMETSTETGQGHEPAGPIAAARDAIQTFTDHATASIESEGNVEHDGDTAKGAAAGCRFPIRRGLGRWSATAMCLLGSRPWRSTAAMIVAHDLD
jgi:hypothetical protein